MEAYEQFEDAIPVNGPLQLTGWNADVVAEKKPAASSTTMALDDQGWVLYTTDIQKAGAFCDAQGNITTKSGKEYSVATLAGNNALVMKTANKELTLELANPEKLEEVYVLAISANGSSDFDVFAVYDDASTSATSTFSPADWFGSYESGSEAQYGLSRIIRSAADTYSADDIDNRYNFRTYEYTMELDRTKMTKALTFKSKVNGSYPTILAVSKKGYKESASGIENLTTGNGALTVVGIYSLDGVKLNSLRKGINIIKMSDGSVKKVLVRK